MAIDVSFRVLRIVGDMEARKHKKLPQTGGARKEMLE